MTTSRREGFVLVLVLWIVAALAATGAVTLTAARQGIQASRNRADIERATWHAAGCLEDMLSEINSVLETPGSEAWSRLETQLRSADSRSIAGCDVRLEPLGSKLDANLAAAETIRRVLMIHGVSMAEADSMAAALQDWIDADNDVSDFGAEAEWYVSRRRPVPRNAPLAAAGELLLIRGFDRDTTVGRYFSTDRMPVLLNHASPVVLTALPGMSPDAARLLVRERESGGTLSLSALADALTGASRDSLMAHYTELSRAVALSPTVWRAAVRIESGLVTVAVAIDVARDDRMPAVLRRRLSIE